MSLKDFNEQILRPMTIRAIESGRLDDIILERDCFEIIVNDEELLKAAANRIRVLQGG